MLHFALIVTFCGVTGAVVMLRWSSTSRRVVDITMDKGRVDVKSRGIFSFASGDCFGMSTTMGSPTSLSFPLISLLAVLSSCGWPANLKSEILCFSICCIEFSVASCRTMVSCNSDSCKIFWIASAVESSPCKSSHSRSFSWSFNSSRRLSISCRLFSVSNFALSFDCCSLWGSRWRRSNGCWFSGA